MQAVAHIHEGTCQISLTLGILLAVTDRHGDLGKFNGHGHQAADPHPQKRSRASCGNRRADSGDISRSDGGPQGRGNRLERRDAQGLFPGLLLLVEHGSRRIFHDKAKPGELNPSDHNRQNQSASHQQHQNRNSPNPTCNCIDKAKNRFHFSYLLLIFSFLWIIAAHTSPRKQYSCTAPGPYPPPC